jgi:hypothetical protein
MKEITWGRIGQVVCSIRIVPFNGISTVARTFHQMDHSIGRARPRKFKL